MLRHALAPVLPRAAEALRIQRTISPGAGAGPGSGVGTVALTFDDGPHPEGTPAVLELLARAGYRATFFMVGEQVERRPELAREVAARGHAIALHGYRHRLQLRLARAAVEADVDQGLDTIVTATNDRPRYHRPPYGIYSPAGLGAVRSRGLTPLLWSSWGKDWRRFTTPGRIAQRVTSKMRDGDVVLLHDADFYSARGSHWRTVEALRLIIAELGRREVATVLPF